MIRARACSGGRAAGPRPRSPESCACCERTERRVHERANRREPARAGAASPGQRSMQPWHCRRSRSPKPSRSHQEPGPAAGSSRRATRPAAQ
eukprot:6547585-Heterocapsa_arctica.AAC.1